PSRTLATARRLRRSNSSTLPCGLIQREIGHKPSTSLTIPVSIAQELAQDGFDVDAFSQSVRGWAAPTLEFDRLIRTGDLEHGNCPVLNWMASNISVSVDNHGNMMPCKKKSTEKIDGIVSAIMAVALCMANTKTPSVYATRGVIAL
ncbi:MAG: hypothetical protein IID41_14695, partial [Planctomycetes bacterium]|nr:hypothetical protein [Planctomycetota bacterium]